MPFINTAALVAQTGRGQRRRSHGCVLTISGADVHRRKQSSASLIGLLPSKENLEGDKQLEVLMLDGSWQQRRAAWTTTHFFICKAGDNSILDTIPLADFDKIAGSKYSSPPAKNGKGNVFSGLLKWPHSKSNQHASTLQSPSEKVSVENTTFFIRTRAGGANAGRTYSLRACSERCPDIIVALRRMSKSARMVAEPKSRYQILQENVRQMIDSQIFQFLAASLIFMNFALNIAESQLNQRLFGENGSANLIGSIFDKVEILFTCIFTVEVLLKAFAYWCRPFFCDSCNLIDSAVILLSLVALFGWPIPFSILRLIRAFRILRFMIYLKSLRKIVSAVTVSLIPVINAFAILLLVTCVYAIIGVAYFDESAPFDFLTFDRAFIALFRVAAGHPWLDSLPSHENDGSINAANVLFLITYIIIVCWILLPVSMAVLVNNFILVSAEVENLESRRRDEAKRADLVAHPLDPLLEKVARYYIDDEDLSDRLQRLFLILNRERSERISFQVLCVALKNLDLNPRIHLSESDRESLTNNGHMCDCTGQIGPVEFELVMRNQLRLFTQRRLARVMVCEANTEATYAPLAALKFLVAQQVLCQKEGPGPAQRVASLSSCSYRQEMGIDNSEAFGTVQYKDVSCLKSGAVGTYCAASKGSEISCVSAFTNAADNDPQAQDGTGVNDDKQATSNVANDQSLTSPANEHTHFVTVGLPELHKLLLSLLEPLQARLEQLLQAQLHCTLPPPGPNAPEAVGQQDPSSAGSIGGYLEKNKTLVPSCSQRQRSKLSAQLPLHAPGCSMVDSGKTFRLEDVVTCTRPSPENTFISFDHDSPSTALRRRPRQLRKLRILSVPPARTGEGQASNSPLQVHDCLEVQGSQITVVDAECKPRQSTWISRSQQPDDGPEWKTCPTADTETEDTSFRDVLRRGRGQSRIFVDSCEPSICVEDNGVVAKLLDVLKAEELCWGGQKHSSSEVSGINLAM